MCCVVVWGVTFRHWEGGSATSLNSDPAGTLWQHVTSSPEHGRPVVGVSSREGTITPRLEGEYCKGHQCCRFHLLSFSCISRSDYIYKIAAFLFLSVSLQNSFAALCFWLTLWMCFHSKKSLSFFNLLPLFMEYGYWANFTSYTKWISANAITFGHPLYKISIFRWSNKCSHMHVGWYFLLV